MLKYLVLLQFLSVSLTLILPRGAVAEDGSKLSLTEIATAAIGQSEEVKISRARVEQSLARYQEAIAAVYPSITGGATQIFRNSASNRNRIDNDIGGGISNREDNQFETTVSIRQPLFTGFREFLVAEALTKETDALRLLSERSEELLYLDVATLYYQIIMYKKDLEILGSTKKTLEQRIQELQGWLDLGKSRESEILQAQGEHAGVLAVIERTKGILKSTETLLSSLTGIPEENLKFDSSLKQEITPSIDTYLLRTQERADLRAAELTTQASEKLRVVAERESWPSLRLEGNVYPYTEPDLEKDWDVLLRMEVPLFDGGAISARVNQAQSQQQVSALERDRIKREATRDVKSIYQELEASRREFELLKMQVLVTEKSFSSLRVDYSNGVVSNLDVLRALTLVQEAKRRMLSAETESKLNEIRLEIAAGGIAR